MRKICAYKKHAWNLKEKYFKAFYLILFYLLIHLSHKMLSHLLGYLNNSFTQMSLDVLQRAVFLNAAIEPVKCY